MQFEPVSRLPVHHLRGSSMQDGARLFACGAFGDSVSLTSTVGGDLQCLVLRAPVARAVAHELLACADALGSEQEMRE